MSVSVTAPYQDFAGATINVPLPVNFPAMALTDIYIAKLLVGGTEFINLVPDVDFTRTDLGGGHYQVTPLATYVSAIVIRVFRITAMTQPYVFDENGPLPADQIEAMGDRLCMIEQETRMLAGIDGASMILPPGSTTFIPYVTFANTAARGAATPIQLGQLGVQLDTRTLYEGTSLAAGGWTRGLNTIPTASTPPTNAAKGGEFYDTSLNFLRARTDSQWVNGSPSSPFLLDLMQGANGTALDAKPGGVQWQKIQGAGGANSIILANNGTICGAVGFVAGIGVYASPVLPEGNYQVYEMDVLYKTSNGVFVAWAFRLDMSNDPSSTPNNGYVAGFNFSAPGTETVQLYRVVSGGLLASAAFTPAGGTTYRMRIEAAGSLLRVYIDTTTTRSTVPVIEFTDATYAGPGRGALWLANASTVAAGALVTRIAGYDGEIAPVYLNDTAPVWNGESLIGSYPNPMEPTIPQRAARLLSTAYGANYQKDAKVMATILAENTATMVNGFTVAGTRPRSIAALADGANDLAAGRPATNVSPPGIVEDMATWVALQKATGYGLVAVSTITPNTAITGAAEVQRLALNALMVGGSTGADIVHDPASNPMFANTGNTLIYFDGIHLTNFGKDIWALDWYLAVTRRMQLGAATAKSLTTSSLMVNGITTQGVQTFVLAAAAATFAITRDMLVISGDAGGNNITSITGAVTPGTVIFMTFLNNLTTFKNNNSGTTNTLYLNGSADFTPTAGSTLTLGWWGQKWAELGRMVR